MPVSGESARLWSVPHFNNLRLMRATYITYAFSRHVHDYFAIGMIESVSTLFIPTDFRDTAVFGLLILVLLIRPWGLFGVRVRGEA